MRAPEMPNVAAYDFGPTHLSRRDMAEAVRANIQQILVDAMSDHIGHALVVAGGQFHFRAAVAKALGGYFSGNRIWIDQIADRMFLFLERQWPGLMERYGMPGVTPKQFLDAVNEISPPTEQEIDEAWEVEIGSDERVMRRMYEGSARTRKGADWGLKKVNVGQDEP